MPTSASCPKKGPPPSLEYLPASSVTPKAPIAPAEPARARAQRAHEAAAARARMPKRIGARAACLDPPARQDAARAQAPRSARLHPSGARAAVQVALRSGGVRWRARAERVPARELGLARVPARPSGHGPGRGRLL